MPRNPTIGDVTISVCDHLNPEFGYQIRIHDVRGNLLLFTGQDPQTGKDLLTYADALSVAAYYQ